MRFSKLYKCLFICCLLALHKPVTAAQCADTSSLPEPGYYLRVSKQYKTAGYVLLIGGTAVLTGTGMLVVGEAFVSLLTLGYHEPRSYKVAALIGAGCLLGSIPLFIASGHHRKKAKALSANIKMDTGWRSLPSGWSRIAYPAVGLVVPL